MKRLLILTLLLVVTSAAAQGNPAINLTGLVAPGFWQFWFTSCNSDAKTPDVAKEETSCKGPSSGGYVCVRNSFLRNALNWSNVPASDAQFRKKAISATLSGNHLHIAWVPRPSEHINSSYEDVYLDDQTHLHGMQVTLAWAGTEFQHYGFTKGEFHRVAKECLGPPGPDELWKIFAF